MAQYDERLVVSLDNSTGTLTTLAFDDDVGADVDYRLTRLFSPSDYRKALIHAAKDVYPALHKRIRNEAKRAGNWLKDGSFEAWSDTDALSYWTESSLTLDRTSNLEYVVHGTYSCAITGEGYLEQTSVVENEDLRHLRGKSVTFKARGWCDTANSLRLSISDGITETFSSYHPGDSAWDDDASSWEVTAAISSKATEVTVRIYNDNAGAESYVDDARLLSGSYDKVFIGDLNIDRHMPIAVSYNTGDIVSGAWVPVKAEAPGDGYLYLRAPGDAYLRIEGMGHLAFESAGVESDSWEAEIDISQPQLQILTAQAALYLCQQLALPNMISGNNEAYIEAYNFWSQELARRKAKFAMQRPLARSVWTWE